MHTGCIGIDRFTFSGTTWDCRTDRMYGRVVIVLAFVGIVVVVGIALIATKRASYHHDEILYLPGLPYQPNKFRHYSGYLRSSETRRLHYWFVESESSPEKDPVVVWLNGGPGCSSLVGLFTENGPYLHNNDGKTLRYNPYSWNKIANMLYLESPAGVGYSYATDRKYNTDDDQTADDNYRAILDFFDKFPHYKGRELVISGESYAGVYIPTLMDRFLNDSGGLNVRGAMIGNGLLDSPTYFIQSNIYFWAFHGVIGNDKYRKLQHLCCGSQHSEEDCHYFPPRNIRCGLLVLELTLEVNLLPLNRYNMFAPCVIPESDHKNVTVGSTNSVMRQALALMQSYLKTMDPSLDTSFADLPEDKPEAGGGGGGSSFVPCVPASSTQDYLRLDNVRRAIHMLPSSVTGLPIWSGCSSLVNDRGSYKSTYPSQLGVLSRLVTSQKYDIVIYYGDQDFVCSFLTGKFALREVVKRTEVQSMSPHRPWYYVASDGSRQVGGFLESYHKFMYLTFKGSGHMVPTDVPPQSLEILRRYLDGSLWL